ASALITALAGLAAGCTNDPYPDADRGEKVLYSSYSEPPKTLDPAVAYTTAEHVITGNVYDTLLEYHYLDRPYRLIPRLAEALPEVTQSPQGGQSYRFHIRRGVQFHADPCFSAVTGKEATREVVAQDIAFALARVADPAVNSPVVTSFADIIGFAEFGK